MAANYPESFQLSDFFHYNTNHQHHPWIDDDASSLSPFSAPYNAHHHLDYTPQPPAAIPTFQQSPHCDTRDRDIDTDKIERVDKVAFKTKSDVEILDDGFKWRKYGKKMVKNSPNPRNYYKCSVEGCLVKKRVERDIEDPRYVVTTYEGIHNHGVPLV